ncbi:MAG: hypothetical protein ACOX2W_11825 [Desulfomonilia bacterium]
MCDRAVSQEMIRADCALVPLPGAPDGEYLAIRPPDILRGQGAGSGDRFSHARKGRSLAGNGLLYQIDANT